MLQTAWLLPRRAPDTGLQPDPFPDQAASLIPGLLAATRTGLTPAGDDELILDHDLHIDLQPWAHPQQVTRFSLSRDLPDRALCLPGMTAV
jgi:hypothetical protein